MTVLALHPHLTYSQACQLLTACGCDPVVRHDREGREYVAHRCAHPEHRDSIPSATTTQGPDGQVLFNCFSCAPPRGDPRRGRWVAQVAGRLLAGTPKEPPDPTRQRGHGGTGATGHGTKVAHYDYIDADGVIVARKVRFQPKSFLWQRPHGDHWADGLRGKPLAELPPYGMHTLDRPDPVYIVEGEKDADRVANLGHAAICAAGSHPDNLPTNLEMLTGRVCIIVADRDPVGIRLAKAWHQRLTHAGSRPVLAQPRIAQPKADVSDHLDAGHTLAELDFGPVSEPGATQIPGPVAISAEDAVFSWSAQLEHIRQAARHRLVAPWATLASVLATVLAETPPHYVLPATIGSAVSLNMAMGIVGASGLGKTAAHSCARDVLHVHHPIAKHIGPGTGEGIIQAFLTWDPERKCNTLTEHPQALLYADEIGQVDSVQSRSGATFGSTIRTMWSGGEVATTNADQTRKRFLHAGTYRLAIVAGIQPTKAGILLDDAGSGTPQRWLWLPAADPGMPDVAPDWPGQLQWQIPEGRPGALDGRVTIGIPPGVADFIRAQHRARQRSGAVDGLDGHLILTQLKAAAAFALLHDTTTVTAQLWDLAGHVMAVSLATREQCVSAVSRARADERRALGAGDVAREEGAREARTQRADRWARLLWATASAGEQGRHANMKHQQGKGCTRRCLTFALRNHRDADADQAISRAVDLDWLREDGGRWWPGDASPSED